MFTSLEQFQKSYTIKNNTQPNETVLNRPNIRLKREVRELKSLVDILLGNSLEEYSDTRFYETDEYVEHNGTIYISLSDDNIANTPNLSPLFWKQVTYRSVADTYKPDNVHDTFYPDGSTTEFTTSRVFQGIPLVFLDGALQNSNMYTYDTQHVYFKTAPNTGSTVDILYGYNYSTGLMLPKRQFDVAADDSKYIFEVTFELTMPYVFKNGKLLSDSDFTWSSSQVVLKEACEVGDVVVVGNGVAVGFDSYSKYELDTKLTEYASLDYVYSKDELQELFDKKLSITDASEKYYEKSDVYTKIELEAVVANEVTSQIEPINNLKADKAESLDGYGIKDAYTIDQTKTYVSNAIDEATRSGNIAEAISNKANIADTLAGYGITDAYTRAEIDEALSGVVSDKQFTGENIKSLLTGISIDAGTLEGKTVNSFMQTQGSTNNDTGISIFVPNDRTQSVQINDQSEGDERIRPEIILSQSGSADINSDQGSDEERVFTELNSNDLIQTVSGEFKGFFSFKFGQAGITNADKYNWVVEVTPTMSGDSLDFVPKGYGNNFEFTSSKSVTSSQSIYNYGFINGNIVNLVSCAQCDDTLKETYAHYTLTGYAKVLSRGSVFNQGDKNKSFNSFNGLRIPEIQYGEKTADTSTPTQLTSDDNGLERILMTQSTDSDTGNTVVTMSDPTTYKSGTNAVENAFFVQCSDYTFEIGDNGCIWAQNGIPGNSVSFSGTNLEFDSQDLTFNVSGFAFAHFNFDKSENGTASITVSSNGYPDKTVTFTVGSESTDEGTEDTGNTDENTDETVSE